MKRSTSLSLVLMSSLSLGLTGCGDEPVNEEFITYNSINDCLKSGEFSAQQCQQMAAEAIAQSPRFSSKEECETTFGIGECDQQHPVSIDQDGQARYSSGSSWMPLMAGFMMGRYMSGGQAMQGAQPLYRGPDQQGGTARAGGVFRTAGGETVRTDAGGKVTNPSQTVRQGFAKTAKPYAGRSVTSSRGGFSGSSKFGSAGS